MDARYTPSIALRHAGARSAARPAPVRRGAPGACYRPVVLPPTSPDLANDATRPYFLWWTDATVGVLRGHLASGDPEERAYWMGALLREANTRDVWLYVTPADIVALWPRLVRHLGRARGMWAFLLQMPDVEWPPTTAGAGSAG